MTVNRVCGSGAQAIASAAQEVTGIEPVTPTMSTDEGFDAYHVSLRDGADGGSRTRILFREADFRTTSAFAAAARAFVVWTIPSP
jgi:hypothetical protein